VAARVDALRQRIDALDEELVTLLSARAACAAIGPSATRLTRPAQSRRRMVSCMRISRNEEAPRIGRMHDGFVSAPRARRTSMRHAIATFAS
jgi:hypothetical protein